MTFLTRERQVEYTYIFEVYRGRIFWASKDGNSALVIPDYIKNGKRLSKTKRYDNSEAPTNNWEKFEHDLHFLRNQKYILNTPPVLYHYIKVSNKTRVKCVRETQSYIGHCFETTPPILLLGPKYAKYLPEQYYAQYIITCYHCNIHNIESINNAYGD